MTAANSPYGDLADDIALLATYGKVIRRHDGMYRLNGAIEKLTAAQVRGMAAELRNRRLAVRYAPAMKAGHEIASDRGPDDPRARMARHEITKTREGTPAGEGEGTLAMHADQAGIALAKPTCTKCGGPRSKWSKGHCAVCYAQAGRGSYPQRPTADVPDKFWRAVEPANEPTKSCGGRGVRTTEDNPAPHASRSQQGQATPDIAPSLPIEAGQECAAVGNVAKPETDTGRPPRSSPPQDTSLQNLQTTTARVPAGNPGNAGGSHGALTPAPEVARPATPATDLAARLADNPFGAYCGCGALRSHTGRCWHRRGLPAPGPVVPERRRSKVSRDSNITALWAEVDALKSSNARLEKAVGELRALMSMEGLR